MKYKVRKLQGGGFATFTPVLKTAPAGAVRPEAKDEDKESALDEDIYKRLINEGGLVNDVNLFVQQMQELESASPYGYLNDDNIVSSYRLIGKVNELIRNKQRFNDAWKKADSAKGLHEVAVDSSGNMFVAKEGNISAVSINEYRKMGEKPKVLTVAELMNHREFNPKLAMNTGIFDVASGSAGMQGINQHIRDMIGIMREFSVSTEKHYSKSDLKKIIASVGNGKQPTERQLEALDAISKIGMAPGEFFKIVEENKKYGRDLAITLEYIWSTLDSPQKLKLDATSALNGHTNPKTYIQAMLADAEGPTKKLNVTPTQDPANLGGSASDKSKPLTPWQLAHEGKLSNPVDKFAFNDPELGVLFRGAVGGTFALMDEKGNDIPMSTMWDVIEGYGYGRIVDDQKIFFGDKKIGIHDRQNVIYDGSTAAQVFMPVGPDGRPDFEQFQTFKNIYKEYEENKDGMTASQAERFFAQHGYRIRIDEQGGEKIIRDNAFIKPFLVMYGYTNSAVEDVVEDNAWIKRLTSDERSDIKGLLERIWTIGSGRNEEDITPNRRLHREKYYKGLITIPYRFTSSAYIDAIVGQGAKEDLVTIGDVQRNIRHSSNIPQNIQASADILK